MKQQLAQEIIACLPNERTLYYYQANEYAFQLLRYLSGQGLSIGKLKKSPFAHLLQKPDIKKRLAQTGDGQLSIDNLWPDFKNPLFPFVLTLSTWGYDKGNLWQQTSRPGTTTLMFPPKGVMAS